MKEEWDRYRQAAQAFVDTFSSTTPRTLEQVLQASTELFAAGIACPPAAGPQYAWDWRAQNPPPFHIASVGRWGMGFLWYEITGNVVHDRDNRLGEPSICDVVRTFQKDLPKLHAQVFDTIDPQRIARASPAQLAGSAGAIMRWRLASPLLGLIRALSQPRLPNTDADNPEL